MVETTQTSEALASALGGDGLMQSEYYKLVFNEETGQWEKQKVTEDIDPVFPGIRDVTPDYSPEGKTFKTIPIGAGPDYAPVVPDVPTLPITQPVEPVVPEQPEVVQPVVAQPDQGPRPDPMDIPTFVNKEKTTVTVGENTFPSTVIKNLPSFRAKYESLPGGFNNWSDSQILRYAIDTGALNKILTQDNNPYYIAEPEKKGFMAEELASVSIPLQMGVNLLDSFFGKGERKALVNRMIKAGMLFGEANNYLDEKGNFKSNDVGRLLKTFKDDNAPQNGLVSPDTNIYESVRERQPFEVAQDKSPAVIRNSSIEEYFGTSAGTSEKELRQRINEMNLEISYYEDLQTEFDTKGTYKGKYAFGKDIANQRFKDLDTLTKLQSEKADILKKIETEDYGKTIYDPTDRTYKSITPELEKKLEQLKSTQATALEGAQTMGQVGIRGVGDTANPFLSTAPQPSFIETLQQFTIKDSKIVPGISKSQPVMGTSGSHVNGEAVYVNSEAGHYTSDGKYHFDSNGDGITDAVASRGNAGNAQEAANSGFIPEVTLSRMTNPDGSLKNLYTPQGGPTGNYGLSSDVIELRDGKYYYTGNVVKENRDVVDNGGNGNTVDNAAPDNSNDNQNYELKKVAEEKKETQGPAGMGTVPSGGGSQDKSADKKEKIVCTEMYRQTQLDDWQRTIKLWYLFQKKYLSETHQKGYHFLFKPFVKGMQKSNILTSVGRHFAQERTKDIKHIMYGTKFSLLGRVYRIILEPICFLVGLLLWQNK